MNTSTYLERREALIDRFSNGIDIWGKDELLIKFNFVSAGLSNFLPAISYDHHEAVFRGILLHKQLSALEQTYFGALQFAQYENLTEAVWQALRSPAIICTFHTGSYRLINQFLTKNDIPYTLVIGSEVLKQQGELIQQLHKDFYSGTSYEPLNLINAEAPSSGLQMMKELKRGKTLLIYIDGNTGAGSRTSQNENNCEISFLGGALFARQGPGFLAHAARVPLLGVSCYRPSMEDIRLRFADPVYPDPASDRTAFATSVTQKLYNEAAPLIEDYPEQWEAWTYLHKVVNVKGVAPEQRRSLPVETETVSFNAKDFGIFKVGTDHFLFNKKLYTSYPITHDTYCLLKEGLAHPISRNTVDPLLFSQLCEKLVLH